MEIRTKLIYLIGSLLTLILLLGFSAIYNTYLLRLDTHNILTYNYNSVKYAREMEAALNQLDKDSTAIDRFVQSLDLQKLNITEANEKQMTEEIAVLFRNVQTDPSLKNLNTLRRSIDKIMQLNLNSIYNRSKVAIATADRSLIWVLLLTTLSTIITLIMLFKFPRSFTKPIKELVDGIDEVSKQNYDKRLKFSMNSEFNAVADSFNEMVGQLSTFRRSSVADIMAAKSYLEATINSITEPIILLDDKKYILFINEAAMNILNLTHDKIANRSALDISLHNDLFRRLIRGLDNNANNDQPLKIYSNNKESYFQVHYTPIAQNSGIVIILSNITDFKELDNAKTNFISTISHELKTPISSIFMSLKQLEDPRLGEMSEDQKILAHKIKENSERLLSITGELLKMTQVEGGKLQLNPKVTKPIELIAYAVNATKILADKFRCNIEIEYPEKVSKLFVDSEKIAWVITNLLSNAIHYSEENSRIILAVKEKENNVEISIRDFGKGIDPRYHNSIFDRYFRVPGTKVQGSGLGLAISKDFIEAHGGTIRVESELGNGSCFTISLKIP